MSARFPAAVTPPAAGGGGAGGGGGGGGARTVSSETGVSERRVSQFGPGISRNSPGAAAAARLLSSMSLSEFVERKVLAKFCSACGKESDAVKTCTACKCVWYCDVTCQKNHRDEHKQECKLIKKVLDKRGGQFDLGTELDIGPLGKLPQREECPICMRMLPVHTMLHTYNACCGKTICGGCDWQHKLMSQELVAKRGQPPVPRTCAFCRTPVPKSDEEMLARKRQKAELKDRNAMRSIGFDYRFGRLGLPVDHAKCIDLFRESAALGDPIALCQLGYFNDTGAMGIEQSKEKALRYFKKAAECGDLVSLHNIGCVKGGNGAPVAAMLHWRLSASGGYKRSMESLLTFFEFGLLHHGDLAETLRAFYLARAEMKSDDRDEFIEYLKENGEYKEEYER